MRTPALWFILLFLALVPAAAQPYRPTEDGEVLERLPRSISGGDLDELRALRRALANAPEDVERATDFARRAIALGRASGDPRYYGYAQAALAPWWEMQDAPVPVLLLRATLRQNRHDFAGAVEDLDRALAVEPRQSGAWMSRAILLLVQGKPREALRSCQWLEGLDRFSAAICAGTVAGRLGKGAEGYDLLANSLAESPAASPELRRWALTHMADIAERLDWMERAEAHYLAALELTDATDSDIYLRAAYADFLLDRNRFREVLDFLEGEESSDALLLRRVLAHLQLGSLEGASAARLRRLLEDRYEAARRRGATLHLGQEARFALEIEGDPGRALKLALDNWEHQREPADARLVLAAAHAADQPWAAEAVAAWVRSTGLEDHRLRPFVPPLRLLGEGGRPEDGIEGGEGGGGR